jgi:hypothetical protein
MAPPPQPYSRSIVMTRNIVGLTFIANHFTAFWLAAL